MQHWEMAIYCDHILKKTKLWCVICYFQVQKHRRFSLWCEDSPKRCGSNSSTITNIGKLGMFFSNLLLFHFRWNYRSCTLLALSTTLTVKVVCRVAVRTWNVAGKPPPEDLDLQGWINLSHPAEIYVFGYELQNNQSLPCPCLARSTGFETLLEAIVTCVLNRSFQEVVPLNANNVLCVEDEGPAALWEAKIRETLNKHRGQYRATLVKSRSEPHPPRTADVDVIVTDIPEVSNVDRLVVEFSSTSFQDGSRSAASEEVILRSRHATSSNQNSDVSLKRSASCRKSARRAHGVTDPPPQEGLVTSILSSNDVPPGDENPRQLYSRVASKQMVGLFVTVWIRSHLWRHVHNVQVSTVGCGLMNHLGNKVRHCRPWCSGFKCEGDNGLHLKVWNVRRCVLSDRSWWDWWL